ncbi:MAG: MBL fold metallo-hydrolase [Actinomycetota bacterium]|nr:MBL fold metallo-hydrolase [Actinomycetota bacterium]
MALHLSQHYLECLSHASYVVADTNSRIAAVVDPQRDIAAYLTEAEEKGFTIKYVVETHFHADFLSGHLELAEATGAEIVFGAQAAGRTDFPITALAHGAVLILGDSESHARLEILETPGHTPESISVVVRENASSVPHAVFTGDTLFIGDVGRPDLLAAVGHTAEDLGRMLYHSLRERLLTLPDSTLVYPAHGAGSACGKNLSTNTVSSIGEQRATNYALAPMSEDQFVATVTEGQSTAPLYFLHAATTNRKARDTFDEEAPLTGLSMTDVVAARTSGAAIVDTRDDGNFALGHLRGSINVGLGGRFAEFTGEVVTAGTPIVIVAEPGKEREATTRLARIGFDNVVGYLDDPVKAFLENPDEVQIASRLTAHDFGARRDSIEGLQLVDVRNPGEFKLGTIDGARHIEMAGLTRRLDELDPTRPTVVFCAGGYRSSIAASTLRANGFDDVSDILGGYNAWSALVDA